MKKAIYIGVWVVALGFVGVVALAAAFLPQLRQLGQEVAAAAPEAARRAPAASQRLTGAASFRVPRAKQCLDPAPVDLGGEEMAAMRVAMGLDGHQIHQSITQSHAMLASCQPVDGEDHSGDAMFELHVGCDGVVKGVEIVDDTIEPAMEDCLLERFRYVEFPAHDMEDGMYFEFPLHFHPPS
jgi:hypothetical protein